jgi:hypothetical protein
MYQSEEVYSLAEIKSASRSSMEADEAEGHGADSQGSCCDRWTEGGDQFQRHKRAGWSRAAAIQPDVANLARFGWATCPEAARLPVEESLEEPRVAAGSRPRWDRGRALTWGGGGLDE